MSPEDLHDYHSFASFPRVSGDEPVLENMSMHGSSFGFPRVSGDEPLRDTPAMRLLLFSPRERG